MNKICFFLLLIALPVSAQGRTDLSTLLMRATFKISGPAGSTGTCFIIGRPMPGDPERGLYVLVTANHVLSSIRGESASIQLRRKDDHKYTSFKISVPIRKRGNPLWIKHPDADIAVMYLKLPKEADIVLLPMKYLISDVELEKYEIGPGDKLFALGYPFGHEANSAGFPILRSGIIASYPIIPTKETKSMLFDFEVFFGNSGGPVFMIQRLPTYGGALRIGGGYQLIIGLVSQQRMAPIGYKTPYEQKIEKHPLKLGVIIHASLIREAIEMLPEKKPPQKNDGDGEK